MLKNLLFFIVFVLGAGMVLTYVFGQSQPTNLGPRNGRLAECPNTPNCVASQSRFPDRRVAPLAVPSNIIDPIAKLKILVEELGKTKVIKEDKDYLWVRFSSKTFGFKDDVEFLLDSRARVVQVRSASRLGRYDFGVNRKRMERIRELFSQGGLSGPAG